MIDWAMGFVLCCLVLMVLALTVNIVLATMDDWRRRGR